MIGKSKISMTKYLLKTIRWNDNVISLVWICQGVFFLMTLFSIFYFSKRHYDRQSRGLAKYCQCKSNPEIFSLWILNISVLITTKPPLAATSLSPAIQNTPSQPAGRKQWNIFFHHLTSSPHLTSFCPLLNNTYSSSRGRKWREIFVIFILLTAVSTSLADWKSQSD